MKLTIEWTSQSRALCLWGRSIEPLIYLWWERANPQSAWWRHRLGYRTATPEEEKVYREWYVDIAKFFPPRKSNS